MTFHDHFSAQAAAYGRARPHYPDELLAHLARLAPARDLAIDVATGNGQAAVGLARHFDQVLAGDASATQLAAAVTHPRVQYVCLRAESLPIGRAVADLVTAAQAAHWFELDRFYAEVRRVLRPGGVVALWTYGMLAVDPACDRVLRNFYRARVGRHWPPQRRYVEEGYRTLPFPFAALSAPTFELAAEYTLEELVDYVGTWSAVARCRQLEGVDPLPELARDLLPVWRGASHRTVRWPLHLLIGQAVPI